MDQSADNCGGVNQLLDEHIAHVDARIAELSQLKQQLTQLRQRCQSEQAVDACGILQGLASMETEPRHARHTHLG
jgi:Tfp pilus assembly protein PilN